MGGAVQRRRDLGFDRPIDRRRFLTGLGSIGLGAFGLGVAGCATNGGGPAPVAAVAPEPDALELAARVRRREVTARELTEQVIARIEAVNPRINAVTTRLFERALGEADGPLREGPFSGVPFLLKDLDDLAEAPTTFGSRLFASHVPAKSSPHTRRSLASGLIVVGKTNTPELGLVATTESALLGPCRNPWEPKHSAGGSSGGAAAAVAAGIVPMAQGTDGGGSIRIPAACCGVFGLKPSRGRNPDDGTPGPLDISVKHVLSRSVRDSASFLAATERRDAGAPLAATGFVEGPSPKRLRIAMHTKSSLGEEAHPAVRDAIEATAELCASLGHRVEARMPDYDGEAFTEHFLDLWTSVPAAILAEVERRGLQPVDVLEPVTIGMALRFRRRPADAVPRAAAFFRDYAERLGAFFDDIDVVLCPVLRTPPIPLGTQGGTLAYQTVIERMVDSVAYTPVWNATGQPAMSIPSGASADGLPIGSQLVGRFGDEATLLSLAYELEAARPGHGERPPIWSGAAA